MARRAPRTARMRRMACGSNRAAGAANGPSAPKLHMITAPAAASADEVSMAARHSSPNKVVTRYGTALPSVSAPMSRPSAKPRRVLNQLAAIFMAGGYTAASAMPVARRSAMSDHAPGAATTMALASAPPRAPAHTSLRAETRSAMLTNAAISVPATKPPCTAIVSHAASTLLRCHSRTMAGVTAVAENQSVMPSSSARAMITSCRQAPAGTVFSWDRIKEPCRYPTRRRRSTMAST